jgi:hypothetical protein
MLNFPQLHLKLRQWELRVKLSGSQFLLLRGEMHLLLKKLSTTVSNILKSKFPTIALLALLISAQSVLFMVIFHLIEG